MFRQQYIDDVGARYGIPTDIWRGLIATESGYNPYAANPVSSARGYTQLLKGTAVELGVNRLDPAQNLDGGARYLSQQFKTFGTWDKAVAAYYQGPGSVKKKGITSAGKDYVGKVFKNAGKTIDDFTDGIKDNTAARVALAGATAGISEAVIAGADILGLGDKCGDWDFICKLREWLKEDNFFIRLTMIVLALIFIGGGLYLFGTGQAQKLIQQAGA